MRFGYFATVLSVLVGSATGYFQMTNPTKDSKWVNGQTYTIEWSKGLYDGINEFDVELMRLSRDGLIYVARNVPVQPPNFSLQINDVPPGDDYFLVFINVTHGVMYATSPRFSIQASGGTEAANKSSTSATVTISGGPNPTAGFATTFPANSNSAVDLWSPAMSMAMGTTLLGSVLGAVWTLVV